MGAKQGRGKDALLRRENKIPGRCARYAQQGGSPGGPVHEVLEYEGEHARRKGAARTDTLRINSILTRSKQPPPEPSPTTYTDRWQLFLSRKYTANARCTRERQRGGVRKGKEG